MDGMTSPAEYIILGAVLFALGLVGFFARRNLIIMFLCTEVMFQGVVLTVVAFSRMWSHLDGQAYALFLLVIAAVEAGLALGLVVLLYRRRGTLDTEVWSVMRG
ncbi:MAG: NADH-quinone oxidoreductase subunit NuoK [Phycisphaerales bacterium]|nr:NADH-quinone oxidoreductase subunit NuoK [Phycisphaerales bacterium]